MNRDREKVVVAYPAGTIDYYFHKDLLALAFFDSAVPGSQGALQGGGKRRIVDVISQGTTNLPHCRNQLVRLFLDHPLKPDWLWFVDTDQTFEPDTLERMLASADPSDRAILGALVFSYDAVKDTVYPTVWGWDDDSHMGRYRMHPVDQLVPCGSTGTGCVLIHRKVLLAVEARRFNVHWPWFQYHEWTNPEGRPDVMGEDLTFFIRAGAAGFTPWVDTRIKVGHRKKWVVDEDAWLKRLAYDDIPAKTFVVVPVKDKLHLTRDLVRQLRDQGGWNGIVVLDNGSQINTREWLAKQPDVVAFDCAGKNIHEMWNLGVTWALGQWPKVNVAILNNDLKLGPEFLQVQAAGLRADPLRMAVCANYDGRRLEEFEQVHGICADRYDGTGGLAGFAMMVKGEWFLAGYRFPEEMGYWFGDNDLCLSMERAGVVYGIVGGTTVEHLDGGGQTAGSWADPKYDVQLAKDREAFRARWASA